MAVPTQLPSWVLFWLFVTTAICVWDATFVVIRPHSLPGGKYSALWPPYELYMKVDGRYRDENDSFVFAQSLLNYGEGALNIVAIICHYYNSGHTRIVAFTVSVMTFWKTVLYYLMSSEYCDGSKYRTGNTFLEELFIFHLPTCVWIFVPLSVVLSLGKSFVSSISQQPIRVKKQK